MKGKMQMEWYIMAGGILFMAGMFGILSLDAVWSPLLLCFGTALVCLQAVSPLAQWRELFAQCNLLRHPVPHESLLLTRLFLSQSWVARREGVLALEDFPHDKDYRNSMYHMGKSLVMDGYDPEFVQGILRRARSLNRQQLCARTRCLRQMGIALLVTGLFSGITGSFAYGIRIFQGKAISMEGMGCLFCLIAFVLLTSAFIGLLLPSKLHSDSYQEQKTQQQIIEGLISLQSGNSPTAILMAQWLFLSPEEKTMLSEHPIIEEYKAPNLPNDAFGNKSYMDLADTIRYQLHQLSSLI